MIDSLHCGEHAACYSLLLASDRCRGQVKHRALGIADEVDCAKDRVELRVYLGEPPGSWGDKVCRDVAQLVSVEVLQCRSHTLGPFIVGIKEYVLLYAIDTGCNHHRVRTDRRVNPLSHKAGVRIDVSLLRFFDNTLCVQWANAHGHQVSHRPVRVLLPSRVNRQPEVGVRVLNSQTVERHRNPVLLGPDDGALTLHGDVGEDVDDGFLRSHRTTAGRAPDAVALASAHAASALSAEVDVVTVQGHVA